MAATIHPSQRRQSCELCRKYKSSCRRLHPNDAKCSRCAMLGVECTSGQQKKVGRPRRAAAPGKGATRDPKVLSSSAHDSQTAWMESTSHEPSINGLNWSDVHVSAPDDGFSTIDADSLNRLLHMPDNNVETYSSSTPFSTINASKPPSYSFDTPLSRTTASSPANRVYTGADTRMPTGTAEIDMDSIAASEALAKLSKMNMDMHVRVAAAEANKDALDFNKMVYREGPLFIENMTLAEFILGAVQEFLAILTQLRASRPRRARVSAYPELSLVSSSQMEYNYISAAATHSFAGPEPLQSPLALTATSIFVQLMTLCELSVKHVTMGVEQQTIKPVRLIPGLGFGGLGLAGTCTQGFMFFSVVAHLLERVERTLGIDMVPEGGEAGLLSARQMEILWGELDGRVHGAMRPVHVREAFDKIGQRLKQISLE